ncbi:MAG TPA: hypothetical protein PKD84_02210 [Propionicimonas sp.]|jgi:hypothetical protein|nr:hypothetical protein [Propionicimonas sp.]
MSEVPPEAAAIAAGPKPSSFIEPPSGAAQPESAATFDPLRLCIFATISMLGWLFGPLTVVVFATVGFLGYWKARKAGLTRSKCYLRDTRLVLAYLGLFLAAGIWGVVFFVLRWLG